MALKHKTVKYARSLSDEDTLYIDADKAAAYVKTIRNQLEKLHDIYEKIEKAYKKAAKNDKTKGIYKTSLNSAQKAADKRAVYCRNRKAEIKARLEKDIQTYTHNLLRGEIDNLKKAVAELQAQANKTDK